MSPPWILRLSLLLNLLLLAVVGWQFSRPQESVPPVAVASPAPAPAVPPPPVRPFRWSELEAPDYPTYIANLRAVGCPEETIRDIIAADVTAMFTEKRQALLATHPRPQTGLSPEASDLLPSGSSTEPSNAATRATNSTSAAVEAGRRHALRNLAQAQQGLLAQLLPPTSVINGAPATTSSAPLPSPADPAATANSSLARLTPLPPVASTGLVESGDAGDGTGRLSFEEATERARIGWKAFNARKMREAQAELAARNGR